MWPFPSDSSMQTWSTINKFICIFDVQVLRTTWFAKVKKNQLNYEITDNDLRLPLCITILTQQPKHDCRGGISIGSNVLLNGSAHRLSYNELHS